MNPSPAPGAPGLRREMGLLALAATGICSMIGAAINVIPFMIQKNEPGIGPYVLPAYVCAAIPAILAALAYAILASAMPRAGGSYVYASRALNPYLGFVASFSQWFGLSTAIGVVSYVLVAFLRDIAVPLGFISLAHTMETGLMRPAIALAFLWFFVGVNLRGLKSYERTLIPLMVVMFLAGFIVIIAGFWFDARDFGAALQAREGATLHRRPTRPSTSRNSSPPPRSCSRASSGSIRSLRREARRRTRSAICRWPSASRW